MAIEPSRKKRPIDLLLVAGSTILIGAALGGTMNAINGAISPTYFRNIMRWDDIENIWNASVAQGIFEGLIYGVLFAIIFTSVVGIVSKVECKFTFALRYLLRIMIAVYCCWIIGGLLAMGLATLSPDFYRSSFLRVPETFGPMLRYAWVGGSIWGALFGGLLSIVIGSLLFANGWKNQSDRGSLKTTENADIA